jgi:putative phosphoesterase
MDGKKILVFSDTHGSIQSLKAVLDWAKNNSPPAGTICAAAFLGDGISDLQPAANAAGFFSDWKIVGGNNDYGAVVPETAVFEFADHRFFMCHGHRHSLYGGYHTIIAAARNSGADAALFGHSHVPFQKNADGLLLVNPGSIGRPRSRIGPTFAVIECIEGLPLKTQFLGIGARGTIREVKIQAV